MRSQPTVLKIVGFFGEMRAAQTTIAPVRTTSMFRNKAVNHYVLQGLLLTAILATAPARAEQNFENVAGSWSGGGLMKPSDGPRERVRCKVDYVVKNEGQAVKMNVLRWLLLGASSRSLDRRESHANFGCTASWPKRRARSVLGHSSASPSRPDATMITALMVKPVI